MAVDVTNIKCVFCLFPVGLAAWVAVSRILDHAHAPADIVAGSLIGGMCAVFFHGRYYPSIWSPNAEFPRSALPPTKASLKVHRKCRAASHPRRGQRFGARRRAVPRRTSDPSESEGQEEPRPEV
jgi:membrane-associated phospholipid phosphatase